MQLTAEITIETTHREVEAPVNSTVSGGRLELNLQKDAYESFTEVVNDMKAIIELFIGQAELI